MKVYLHHVNISTTNLPEVDKFYREVFGLSAAKNMSADNQITSSGYEHRASFLWDGNIEFHLAPQDLSVSYRLNQPVNPMERGHIGFQTDDIEAFKQRLRDLGVPFADYGVWAVDGWYQIFFQDPAGTVIEVNQTDYKKP